MRFLTAGESHGKALIGIIEGLPSGIGISKSAVQLELTRRKMGYGRGARQKIETDEVEILSGVRHGTSLGSPITLLIWNKDFANWQEIMQPEPLKIKNKKRKVDIPRPGHADLIGGLKYNHQDLRNVLERASARETACRVAVGSVARAFLNQLGIQIASRVRSIGGIEDSTDFNSNLNSLNKKADASVVRVLNKTIEKNIISAIDRAKASGDSLGGTFTVYASGLPRGLGSYVQWDRRLEGKIAQAFSSLNAIKGVEFGLGFKSADLPGSQVHDEIIIRKGKVGLKTNKTGGIVGGMSSGDMIVVSAAMKPIATLMNPLNSIELSSKTAKKAHVERSDFCAVPAASVIGESLLALCLAEAILEKFGGDSLTEIQTRIKSWDK